MSDRTASDRGRRARRFLLGALVAAALAVAMSGCVIFKSTSSSQPAILGPVQITSTICASDTESTPDNSGYNPADSACQGSTKGGNYPGDAQDGGIELLLAYRIPNNVTAPTSFTSSTTSNPPTTPCGGGIVFTQSSSYISQLTSNSPPGSGKQWVGYISTQQSYTQAGCQYVTVAPSFTIKQPDSSPPFQGPFNYRVIVGFRTADASHDPSRAVSCNADITKSADNGICADDPGSATISGTDLSQTTRDLGVVPTNTSVDAGATASVPFNLKYAGAAGASFSVSASTDVPSATATPSITSLTPTADTNNNMTVSVPVPAGTAPGTYHVTVTATGTSFTSGQNRSGTANLTVGALSFNTAPALPSLGTITLNGQAQTTTAQMNNFSVNDTTSSPSGWNVTVAGDGSGSNSAVFKQYCSNGASACGSDAANSYVSGGRTLLANSLSLNSTGASWTGGTGSAPTFKCGGGSCAIDSATPTKVAAAANGSAGTGVWSTSGFTSSSVSLATPSTLRVLPTNEIYRLNVVWSLNSGP